jgi:hypothetical protein
MSFSGKLNVLLWHLKDTIYPKNKKRRIRRRIRGEAI